jgi:hypothetical protein
MNRLDEKYKSCKYKWDCENCDKTLCLRTAAVADFPTTYGHFGVIAFMTTRTRKTISWWLKETLFRAKAS